MRRSSAPSPDEKKSFSSAQENEEREPSDYFANRTLTFTVPSAFNLKVIHSRMSNMEKWDEKCVIVAPLHFRVTSDLVMHLLTENVKVIGLTNYLKRSETFRSTLPYKNITNFITYECDLHSIASMKATFLRIRHLIGEVQLFIYLLPKLQIDDTEQIYQRGNEMRLQQLLDVSLEAARMALRQAELILFPPCCDEMCNSEQMWIVRYGIESQDDVVNQILSRMAGSDCRSTLCTATNQNREMHYSFKLTPSSHKMLPK